jgi:hypothetical protein
MLDLCGTIRGLIPQSESRALGASECIASVRGTHEQGCSISNGSK